MYTKFSKTVTFIYSDISRYIVQQRWVWMSRCGNICALDTLYMYTVDSFT